VTGDLPVAVALLLTMWCGRRKCHGGRLEKSLVWHRKEDVLTTFGGQVLKAEAECTAKNLRHHQDPGRRHPRV